MRKMIRNRELGKAVDGMESHFDEYQTAYIAGAFGFLLGGLTVMVLTGRSSRTNLVVVR